MRDPNARESNTQVMSEREPTIIVGAGPVGLVSALRLARMGLPSIVLEAADTFPIDLRASTFHPPTLDMLDDLGVGETFVAMGEKAPFWQVLDVDTGHRAVFDVGVLAGEVRHPFRLQCEQYKLTPLLHEAARATGLVDVRFGARATGVRQDADRVTVTFEQAGATRELSAPWLIGADGAHSVVRRSIGLSLEGETYPSVTVLITTPFPLERHLRDVAAANYIYTSARSGSIFKLPGEWRVTYYPHEGESEDSMLSDASVNECLNAIAPGTAPWPLTEVRAYRIHKRIAPDYRVGRVTLAGDAAHLNAPTGGMGMNGGIHDAVNLTDKLSRVIRGDSPDLIDLYTRQRRPVAKNDMLAQSDGNRKRMEDRAPARRREIIDGLRAIAADPVRHKAWVAKASMLDGLRAGAATT